ncbi:MAG: hypothetical protein G01um101477_86 [Candidatus Doudnabacteria bacterium Gr01-1014_77]|uniref:Type II secretion system protein GspG C-terminal domain-containing protein n=1 Tax=Candidatus Doudnabacteria bacterium Gr01-1014_77 TaxID=2017133 RepID=A0A554JDM0_9BACT|nr:MAG: hypothetical protein G01um101477_86 [Candidatus Doudnabacteria bacterium Gr01-1014_77]
MSNEIIPPSARNISREKLQLIVLVAVVLLFALILIWGIFSGLALGKAKSTYRQVDNINTALQYYYKDQDRYPTADQFNNQKILVPYYMQSMPTPESAGSGACSNIKDFVYSQKTPKTFSLQFCMNAKANGLSGGVHILTEQSLQ